jgi:hypothetical protein
MPTWLVGPLRLGEDTGTSRALGMVCTDLERPEVNRDKPIQRPRLSGPRLLRATRTDVRRLRRISSSRCKDHHRALGHGGTQFSSDMDDLAPRIGGARRDRTDDLMLAKHALSQLSYGPSFPRPPRPALDHWDPATRIWWAWKDLNFRPHAYQARALTN